MKKKLSQYHPTLYTLAVRYFRTKRYLRESMKRVDFANELQPKTRRAHLVKKHSSRLIKQLGRAELQLQYNKVENLKICLPFINGLVIRPGQTFSFWERIGEPTSKRGFLEGMELSNGKAQRGIGGGICQLANMLHWLVLHSPLTVIERSTHSFDPFPDHHRSIPFGTGCAVFYNYVDFRFRNDTKHSFQIHVGMTEKDLWGEMRSQQRLEHAYKIYEEKHAFTLQSGTFYRENEIWRLIRNRDTGRHIRRERIKKNAVRVMYTPKTWVEK